MVERVLVCEVDMREGGVTADAEGEVLPGGDLDSDAAEHMESEVPEPGIDDAGMSIPGLDHSLVDLALKVFLGFFVDKRTTDDGPEGALGGEEDDGGGGDVKSGCCVRRKVGEQVEQLRVMRP